MSKQKKRASAQQEQQKADQTQQQQQGREENGQFARGNGFGPGNPFARTVARLRQVAHRVVTEEELEQVFRALLEQAKQGHVPAAKLVLSYTVGKPTTAENPDTVDHQELEMAHQGKQSAVKGLQHAQSMPPAVAANIVRLASGTNELQQHRVLAKWFRQGYVDPADVPPRQGNLADAFGLHGQGSPSGHSDAEEWARLDAQFRREAEARAAQRRDKKSP